MQKENVVIVVKKDSVEHLAPSGRGWHEVPGEGVLNKEHFIGTPSSPLRGTSPARGEVNGGFTLIELLVVVLIIGILAAVAVPQYQKAVEKVRMTEAIINVRTIAQAHQVYHLTNGSYVGSEDLDKLDVTLSGVEQITTGSLRGRWKSKDFIYAPNGSGESGIYLAHARRYIKDQDDQLYAIVITQANPQRISCNTYEDITPIQRSLCKQLNDNGTL